MTDAIMTMWNFFEGLYTHRRRPGGSYVFKSSCFVILFVGFTFWANQEWENLHWGLKLFAICAILLATEVAKPYLKLRDYSISEEPPTCPNYVCFGNEERLTLENLTAHSWAKDHKRIFLAAVSLWKLRDQIHKDLPESVLVVRDKSDCLNPQTLKPQFRQLQQFKRADWAALLEMARQKYYTLIHEDIRVWQGQRGQRYFERNRIKIKKAGKKFDFKRLFAFPYEKQLKNKIQRAEAVLGAKLSAHIASEIIRCVNGHLEFEGAWAEVNNFLISYFGAAPEEALKEEAYQAANIYFDMALLVSVIRGHANRGIEYIVANSEAGWYVPSQGEKDLREVLIEGSNVFPMEHPIRDNSRASSALIDKTAIIQVYIDVDGYGAVDSSHNPGEKRRLLDGEETALIYEFDFKKEHIDDFANAIQAIWNHYLSGDGRPTFFRANDDSGKILEAFCAQFSQHLADRIADIEPIG